MMIEIVLFILLEKIIFFKNSRNLMDYGLHTNSAYNHLKEVSYDNVYGNNRYWFTSVSYAEWQTTIKHESGVGAWKIFYEFKPCNKIPSK